MADTLQDNILDYLKLSIHEDDLPLTMMASDLEYVVVEWAKTLEQTDKPLWQPMETAPMDGTRIDLWSNSTRFTGCQQHPDNPAWADGQWIRFNRTSARWHTIDDPLFWMPSPENPS